VTIKTVTVEIEQEAYDEIHHALQKFGDNEIGGILIGYKKEDNHFAISEATVADDTNSFNLASFIREPFKSMKLLLKSFKLKKHNYIGEWHSHPRFSLYPSTHDVKTMKGIVADPGYGVDFALLIITKLENGRPNMAGFLFHKKMCNFVQATISGIRNEKGRIDISV
jgi:proteasome lid subunit RPN8/RPN11